MANPNVASADALLGRLQRGRGQGYLDAISAERAEGAAVLITCLTSDPRTDHQVESRDEYYGRLAFEIGLELASLEEFLLGSRLDDAADDAWRDALALQALGWMGRLGRRDAVDLLRRYVAQGRDWTTALEAMTSPTTLDVSGVDIVVSDRCSSIEELAQALPYVDQYPWTEWRRTNERIRAAFARHDEERQEQARRRAELSRVSTAELLRRREVSALRGRSSEEDKAVLLSAARGDDPQTRHDAIKELGWQRDARVLYAAENELRRFPDREWPPNAGAIAVLQLAREGPIPRVRQWLGQPGRLGEVAMSVVAVWPQPGDEQMLRSMAAQFRDLDWLYRACDAVDGLVKLTDTGAVPDLEEIFRETTYSYLRHRAARALALLSSAFPSRLAVECLWDCEGRTVMVGCASATTTSPAVRERLVELTSDRFTPRRIRSLAGRRRSALEPKLS